MIEMELIERTEKNSREIYYNPSDLGFASVLTCLTMRKVLDEVKRKRR